jgi:5'-nucleotidase
VLIEAGTRSIMKKILVTNDDGIDAPGIKALEESMSELGEVIVVAPSSQQSATGRGFTLGSPVRVNKRDDNHFSVDGVPVDCVFIGMTKLVKDVDLVVSGINIGANLGIHSLMRSGTCGAAFEAANLGVPSIAVSIESTPEEAHNMEGSHLFDEAQKIMKKLVSGIIEKGLPGDVKMLNVNVPIGEPKGVEVTRLGEEYVTPLLKEVEDSVYVIGGVIEPKEKPGTDIYTLHDERKISITPIAIEGFEHGIIDFGEWLKKI